MSKILASLGGNTGAVLAGGGMVAALAVGAYIGLGQDTAPREVTSAQPASASVAEPQKTQAAAPQPEPAAQAAPEASEQVQSPTFDELRRETDGTTIIAGRAAPLSEVKILVDGAEVASATADSTGGFAAIADLPPQDRAQIVSLSAQEGETVTASLDEVILAPTSVAVPRPVEIKAPQTPVETAQTQEAAEPVVQTPVPIAEASPVTEAPAAPVLAQPKPEAEPVPEPAQDAPRIALLKSDAEGVSLLQPARPEAMTAVALDTIGYSDLGDVQLTGRAQPDTAKVRIYLDNRAVISLPVGADGRWRGDLPDVDEGVYTLRVDEVSSQGAVSSRVETPFKRESAEVLAQAAAASDGPVKSITVQTGATLWAIARDRYGDGTLYLRVVEANADSIRNPDLIYPGQVFDLPN